MCVCAYDSMECSVGRLIKAMMGHGLKMEPASSCRVLQGLEMTQGGMMEEEGATCLKRV